MTKKAKQLLAIVFISTLFLSSCSKDDETSKSIFNPPNWIAGTWLEKPSNTKNQSGYKFTANNVILILKTNSGIQEVLNQREALKPAVEIGQTKIEETKSDTYYTAKIISGGITVTEYKFQKISDNVILEKTANLNVELYKQ